MTTKPADTLPTLNTRADVSYLDFVEGLRYFVVDGGEPIQARIQQGLDEAGRMRGAPLRSLEEIKPVMDAMPLAQMRNRLVRSQREMKWHKITESMHAQREQLSAELEQYAERGPGSLELDPDFETPAYANVHFHLQPTGYYKDELAGYMYHYGTKVFFQGANDGDELHGRIVAGLPEPEDGRVTRILDLACSIGQSTTALKSRFPQAEVWGIDHSAPMLRCAHRRAVMLDTEVNFSQRLAEDPAFPDDHFDVVFAFILFHEIPVSVIHQTLSEVARMLRPGGLFAASDFLASANMDALQIYHRDFDARHNGEPYSQDFCDLDFAAVLGVAGMKVVADSSNAYVQSWLASV